MSIDSGLANPIPDNGLAEAPDFLLEPEATLVDANEEMARGTQHADWVGHTVEVASANKIYLGEGLESRSRTGFARPLDAQECTRDSLPHWRAKAHCERPCVFARQIMGAGQA